MEFQKYEVLRQIGAGGMGKVYLARDRNLDRLVVMKESNNGFLLVEAEILKGLAHPGLPAVYDCFPWREGTCLVMEYIEGMSLRQNLDRHKRVPEGQAVEWAVQLCGILAYLHNRHPSVIYRDLKPENIMICENGELKLIDFGGALRCTWGNEREEVCVGTRGYCPPEQWRDTQGDVAWDIYGLGAVLHEMLTGANPAAPPCGKRPIMEYDKGLSRALDGIIQKCLANVPGDRYPSMGLLQKELCQYHKLKPWDRAWKTAGKLFLGALAGYTAICFILPFLRGIPENEIPFPYLEKPLIFLLITIVFNLIFFRWNHKKQCLCRQEKNIWLTEKGFSGLVSLWLLAAWGVLGMSAVHLTPPSLAKSETGELWVEMRDGQGRKMLLRDGAVYHTQDRARFELPADSLPDGKVSLQFVAVGEDGHTYCSRVFYLSGDRQVP